MPTYQYACTACEHRFEAVQSFSDASLAECPECSGKLRKLFGAVGVVFKGSGFYRTDSRSASKSTSSTTSSTPAASSDTKASEKKTSEKKTSSSDSKSSTSAPAAAAAS